MNDLSLGRRRLFSPALVAAACGTSPEPVYYTIVPRTGDLAAPQVVLLKDIGLASYLDRRRSCAVESYKLDIRANDWWGEPLAACSAACWWSSCRTPAQQHGLRRKRRHHRRPQLHRRRQHPAARRRQGGLADPVAQVAAEFNRPRRTAARTFTITKPARHPGYAGLVAAISDAVVNWPTASRRCCQ